MHSITTAHGGPAWVLTTRIICPLASYPQSPPEVSTTALMTAALVKKPPGMLVQLTGTVQELVTELLAGIENGAGSTQPSPAKVGALMVTFASGALPEVVMIVNGTLCGA